MTDYAKVRAMLKEGEGSISHMYLDTKGYVTVGVGQLLRTVDDAQALDFVNRDTHEKATDEEIAQDFRAVENEEPGYRASHYRQFTKLDLPEQAIDDLLDSRIAEFENGLRGEFPGFDSFPEAAQAGLLDMAFNLGISGLVNKFPTFTRAARQQDWATCARECRRSGIGDRRNEETRKLFEEAGRREA